MLRKRVFLFIVCFLLFCIINVFIFNKIADKQYGEKKLTIEEKEEVKDYNNVSIVDAKLGSPYSITTGYLKTYATKKSGIWYQSQALVEHIVFQNDVSTIYLEDKEKKETSIVARYYGSVEIKKGDVVTFVGAIKLDDSSLLLTKIAKEDFSYYDATIISFEELESNIHLLEKQEFIINGFLVNDTTRYLLYDSKEEYLNNQSKDYFILHFADEPSFLENQNVKISCQLENSYSLKNCKLK